MGNGARRVKAVFSVESARRNRNSPASLGVPAGWPAAAASLSVSGPLTVSRALSAIVCTEPKQQQRVLPCGVYWPRLPSRQCCTETFLPRPKNASSSSPIIPTVTASTAASPAAHLRQGRRHRLLQGAGFRTGRLFPKGRPRGDHRRHSGRQFRLPRRRLRRIRRHRVHALSLWFLRPPCSAAVAPRRVFGHGRSFRVAAASLVGRSSGARRDDEFWSHARCHGGGGAR